MIWIPVTERLPQFDNQVFVWGWVEVDCVKHEIAAVASRFPKGWDVYGLDGLDYTVTHWAEIVPPEDVQP